MKKLNKKMSEAFCKNIFFLGKDKDGRNHWLEAGKWDCNWYWAFGYVETYNNNDRPDLASDINCHTHFDYMVLNEKDIYTINNILNTPLTESESWELSDLMKSFYTLKETSGIFNRGNSNVTSTKNLSLKDYRIYKKINTEIIPNIINRVYEILTPDDKEPIKCSLPSIRSK